MNELLKFTFRYVRCDGLMRGRVISDVRVRNSVLIGGKMRFGGLLYPVRPG